MQRKWVLLVFLGLSLLLFIYIVRGSAAPNGTVQVSYINVGQGDAALIHDPSNFDVLIDGGKTTAGPIVLQYLRDQGIDDIDVMVVSHADSDHVGGLIDVLDAADIPVQEVLYNGYPGDTATWHAFETAVHTEGITMTAAQYPQEYIWGETTAHILNPASGLASPETNDASIVVLLDHGQNQFLFTGDIDGTIEATVKARGTPVLAEVLKVAHHGSRYSSGAAFLSAVGPQEAVISVGDNPYGDPADETLARLAAAGARIWRTDQNGTIVVFSDGATYSVHPEPNYIIYLPFVVLSSPPTLTPTPRNTKTPTATPTWTITPWHTVMRTKTPTPTATLLR